MLEESEGAFNLMPLLIELLVICTLNEAIAFWRDHRYPALRFDIFDDGIGVIAFIRKQCCKMQALHERNRLHTIRFLAAGQNESERMAKRIAYAVYFGGESAA